jgi:hypothetical protein
MLKKFWHLVLVVLPLLTSYTFSADRDEINGSIKFYNVGGHAALITMDGRPPLLCDCGWTAYRTINNDQGIIREPIVNDILAEFVDDLSAQYDGRFPMSLCISHPSVDHYNLIRDIVLQLRDNTSGTPLKIHTVLGGDRADYRDDFIQTLTDIHRVDAGILQGEVNDNDFMRFTNMRAVNNEEEIDWLLQRYTEEDEVNWHGDPSVTHLLGHTDLHIIPHGQRIHDQKSIVTRVNIPEWSALIQGDALNFTTNAIMAQEHELESDIFQASLQGGLGTNGNGENSANSATWIRHINPRYGVFSAGSHAGHRHPRAEVMNRFLFEGNRLVHNMHRHFLHYYNPNNVAVQFLHNPGIVPPELNQYGGHIGNTRYGIFTTFTLSGNRTLSFNTEQNEPVYPLALPNYLA